MAAIRITEDNLFTVLTRGSWLLVALLALGGLITVSAAFALSVLVGGMLAIANFYWLRSILRRALDQQADRASRFAQLRYLLRFALLGVAIYLLVVVGKADVIGLLLGLSVLVISIIGVAIYYSVTLKGG